MRENAAGADRATMGETFLHITNGDSAADLIRAAGVGGDVLPWRDVPHEGPVPAGLGLRELSKIRAAYLSGMGWGEPDWILDSFHRRDGQLGNFAAYAETVLWFEHDLYDQLQLIQLLDWFSRQSIPPAAVSLICVDRYISYHTPAGIPRLFSSRRPVTGDELQTGRAAWTAFRSANPLDITSLLTTDLSALPFLRGALIRLLQQYPSVRNGLNRTENAILEELANGPVNFGPLFKRTQLEREDPMFMGDTTFMAYLEGMSNVARPLLLYIDGTAVTASGPARNRDISSQREIAITTLGETVLHGEADWIGINGIDRWIGGVRLAGKGPVWRWDGERGRLVQPGR